MNRKQNPAFIRVCLCLNDDRNPVNMTENHVWNISNMCVSQSLASLISVHNIISLRKYVFDQNFSKWAIWWLGTVSNLGNFDLTFNVTVVQLPWDHLAFYSLSVLGHRHLLQFLLGFWSHSEKKSISSPKCSVYKLRCILVHTMNKWMKQYFKTYRILQLNQ